MTEDQKPGADAPRAPRPQRAAFALFHAGEVYARDSVRWYSPRYVGEGERFYQEYHNVGDSVVYDSTLKVLDFDIIIPVDFNNPDPLVVERIKATCSHGILRGSNYFHEEMQWGNLIGFIHRIGLPIIVLGVGVQSPLGKVGGIGPASTRVAQALGDYCVSIGVRGTRSAEQFADAGVKNVRVVGCPSMFRSLKPRWQRLPFDFPEKPLRTVRTAVTLRREIGPDYVVNVRDYLAVQRRFIESAVASTNVTLFAQGELFEKYFFHGRMDLISKEVDEAIEQGWITGPDDIMLSIYKKHIFYSDDVTRFCQILAQANFVSGFRVHGVLPALGMGIPGVLVNYDHRTAELIQTFGIPSIPLEDCTFQKAYDVARTYDYDIITSRYAEVRSAAISYFAENAIPHRLGL